MSTKPTDQTSSADDTAGDGRPPIKHLTFSQQVFIWAMVILVGLIFGVGSSWSFLQHANTRDIGGISEIELMSRMDAARRLQVILPDEPIEIGGEQQLAMFLQHARYADRLGLQPAGEALDQVVEEFLGRTGKTGRTYRELLAERVGGKGAVTRRELETYLAERRAYEALQARYVVVPAVPRAAAQDMESILGQELSCDVVELDATHLLPQVPADDPELQATYDKLKASRFVQPATALVTLAYADPAALMAAVTPAESEIAARYEQVKESRFRVPGSETTAFRPLDEVRAGLVQELAQEQAQKVGQAKVQAFNASIEELGLDRADATSAGFAAAAVHAGLVTRAASIPQSQDGVLDLADLGRVKDPAGIFGKDAGFITNPLQAGGSQQVWFVLRVEGQTKEGYKPLEAVREEVQVEVAGTRTWKALMEQAEAIRSATEQAGPGGLAAWAKSDAATVWKTNLRTVPRVPLLTPLRQPNPDGLAVASDPPLAISLAVPKRPVVIADAGPAKGAPKVMLIQANRIETGPALDAVPTGEYRNGLMRYRSQAFGMELKRELGN